MTEWQSISKLLNLKKLILEQSEFGNPDDNLDEWLLQNEPFEGLTVKEITLQWDNDWQWDRDHGN